MSFDRTGSGTSIYPAMTPKDDGKPPKILEKLNAMEAARADAEGTKPRTWSRRTLFVYLQLLEQADVLTNAGSAHNRLPRQRALHAEALLTVPVTRESCTRRPSESCTRKAANPALNKPREELQASAPPNVVEAALHGITDSKSSSEVSTATPANSKPDDDRERVSLNSPKTNSLTDETENQGDREARLRDIAKRDFHRETNYAYDDELVTIWLNNIQLRKPAKPLSSSNYFLVGLRNELTYALGVRRAAPEPVQPKQPASTPERVKLIERVKLCIYESHHSGYDVDFLMDKGYGVCDWIAPSTHDWESCPICNGRELTEEEWTEIGYAVMEKEANDPERIPF
jgi:hypothetical protein